ncbi:MAG: glycoside hydrolase family 97 catalytic domain-containing protein, partial [Clostridia bacterium]|nr:glycoside hydrolase family 97 catalytic domain-containing protein [Clostridia bacterium]
MTYYVTPIIKKLYDLSGKTTVTLTEENGRIYYEATNNRVVKFGKGLIGMTVGKTFDAPEDYSVGNFVASVTAEKTEHRKFTVFGRKENREENSVLYDIKIRHGERGFLLQIKIFENAVAFRYIFEKTCGQYVFGEQTEFVLPPQSKVYATFGCRNPNCNTKLNGQPSLCYESTYAEYDPSEKFRATEYVAEKDCLKNEDYFNYVLFPMTVKYADGTFGYLSEADVYDYAGSSLYPFGNYRFGLNTAASDGRFITFETENEVKTPWRILAFGEDLNEIYNNGIAEALMQRAEKDFSFVKPGRSAWHWHVEALWGNFISAPGGYEMMQRYTLAAAKLGFEYNIMDEGWRKMTSVINEKESDYKECVKNLAAIGKKYGVALVLWTGFINNYINHKDFYSRGEAELSPKEAIDEIVALGGAGAKVDFFRTESNLYSGVDMYGRILDYCADNRLICDLHGSIKPTGLSAKYPNELSREGIRGMENYKYSPVCYPDIAYAFTTLTFVRGAAGHGDWTPFITDGIGLATILLTDSPINAISATTEELLSHPAIDLIKSIPTSFTETKILPVSKFGEFISVVKEKDGNFWIAGINATDEPVIQTINLGECFGKGDFQYELWCDTSSGLKRTFDLLQDKHSVTVTVSPNGGYAGRFSRLKLNYYGGEITKDVLLTEWSGGEIFYTLDESDPET